MFEKFIDTLSNTWNSIPSGFQMLIALVLFLAMGWPYMLRCWELMSNEDVVKREKQKESKQLELFKGGK